MASELEIFRRSLEGVLTGVAPSELAARPAAGKWSGTEVLEHLTLSYTGTTRGLKRCLETGRPTAGKPSLRDRFFQMVVTGFGYLPSGRQAPAVTLPKGSLTAETAVGEFYSAFGEMEKTLSECRSRFGGNAKILDHPVLGPLTVPQWEKFHRLHGEHHLQQVSRIRQLTKQVAQGA